MLSASLSGSPLHVWSSTKGPGSSSLKLSSSETTDYDDDDEHSEVTDGGSSRALMTAAYFAHFQPSLPPRHANPLLVEMRVTYEGVAVKKGFAEPLHTT